MMTMNTPQAGGRDRVPKSLESLASLPLDVRLGAHGATSERLKADLEYGRF